jgi:hypothetical protein
VYGCPSFLLLAASLPWLLSIAAQLLWTPRAECDVTVLLICCWLQAYGEGVVLEWLRKAPPIIRMEEEVRLCCLTCLTDTVAVLTEGAGGACRVSRHVVDERVLGLQRAQQAACVENVLWVSSGRVWRRSGLATVKLWPVDALSVPPACHTMHAVHKLFHPDLTVTIVLSHTHFDVLTHCTCSFPACYNVFPVLTHACRSPAA